MPPGSPPAWARRRGPIRWRKGYRIRVDDEAGKLGDGIFCDTPHFSGRPIYLRTPAFPPSSSGLTRESICQPLRFKARVAGNDTDIRGQWRLSSWTSSGGVVACEWILGSSTRITEERMRLGLSADPLDRPEDDGGESAACPRPLWERERFNILTSAKC
jgi:hypothetical protein